MSIFSKTKTHAELEHERDERKAKAKDAHDRMVVKLTSMRTETNETLEREHVEADAGFAAGLAANEAKLAVEFARVVDPLVLAYINDPTRPKAALVQAAVQDFAARTREGTGAPLCPRALAFSIAAAFGTDVLARTGHEMFTSSEWLMAASDNALRTSEGHLSHFADALENLERAVATSASNTKGLPATTRSGIVRAHVTSGARSAALAKHDEALRAIALGKAARNAPVPVELKKPVYDSHAEAELAGFEPLR